MEWSNFLLGGYNDLSNSKDLEMKGYAGVSMSRHTHMQTLSET